MTYVEKVLLLAIEIGFLKVSKRIKNYKMIGSIILILTLVVLVVFKYQKMIIILVFFLRIKILS